MENNSAPFHRIDLSNSPLIFADTSFVLNLLDYNGNASMRQECEDFVWSTIRAKAAFVITAVTERELYDIFLRDEYKHHFAGDFSDRDLKLLRTQDPQKLADMLEKALKRKNGAIDTLNSSGAFYDEIVGKEYPSLLDEAVLIQSQCSIPGLNDAFQIALARKYGEIFATTDQDFNRVNVDKLLIAVDEITYRNHYQ